MISADEFAALRLARRRLPSGEPVRSLADAAAFVNARGFCTLGGIRNLPLPSLSEADEQPPWSDDFVITSLAWEAKELLPAQQACLYLRFFQGRGTLISWEFLPYFYALYGRSADPDLAWHEGILSPADRLVLATLHEAGPLDSRTLWRRLRPRLGGRHVFLQALDRLQQNFQVVVAGGSTEGWSMHLWDVLPRAAPAGALRPVPRDEAASRLVTRAVENLVLTTRRELGRVLRMTQSELDPVLEPLVAGGVLRTDYRLERHPGARVGMADLGPA